MLTTHCSVTPVETESQFMRQLCMRIVDMSFNKNSMRPPYAVLQL